MDKKQTGPERRQHERFQYQYLKDFSISFRDPGSEHFHISDTGNLSYGGALVCSAVPFTMDAPIDIQLCFTEHEPVSTVLQAEVRWLDKKTDETGAVLFFVGAQFVNLSDTQKKILHHFIRKYISPDII
ncbi:MAG: PilZ domain-containing protein [Deltaproteobacteria bacterium]|nr:PilZ domain-containing protein [Deltaproteobacteria bacterium]